MTDSTPITGEAKPSDELAIDFVKSSLYRNVSIDGIFGGLTPKLQIHMAVFSEHQPLPTRIVHELKDGRLGQEKVEKRIVSGEMERELEASITMSPEVAQLVVRWLQGQIEQVNAMRRAARDEREKGKR
ncbi:MAG TPA: hypothetical protein VMS31_01235 [Pyrinomonadaceae bacterium]|nr:hypothetical protein [Pyrinomonadaceae bacterium]